MAESFFASLKLELVYQVQWPTRAEARSAIGGYFGFYNTRRPHSSLQRRTPDRAYCSSCYDHVSLLNLCAIDQYRINSMENPSFIGAHALTIATGQSAGQARTQFEVFRGLLPARASRDRLSGRRAHAQLADHGWACGAAPATPSVRTCSASTRKSKSSRRQRRSK